MLINETLKDRQRTQHWYGKIKPGPRIGMQFVVTGLVSESITVEYVDKAGAKENQGNLRTQTAKSGRVGG